jgi:hypothetical protein
MASEKIDRRFPGRGSKDIYERLLARVSEVASRYALKVESDPQRLTGRVHRPGADVKFNVLGEELHVDLDFSFIVPGALRQRVKDELASRLDTLFDERPA